MAALLLPALRSLGPAGACMVTAARNSLQALPVCHLPAGPNRITTAFSPSRLGQRAQHTHIEDAPVPHTLVRIENSDSGSARVQCTRRSG